MTKLSDLHHAALPLLGVTGAILGPLHPVLVPDTDGGALRGCHCADKDLGVLGGCLYQFVFVAQQLSKPGDLDAWGPLFVAVDEFATSHNHDQLSGLQAAYDAVLATYPIDTTGFVRGWCADVLDSTPDFFAGALR